MVSDRISHCINSKWVCGLRLGMRVEAGGSGWKRVEAGGSGWKRVDQEGAVLGWLWVDLSDFGETEIDWMASRIINKVPLVYPAQQTTRFRV